MAQLPSLVFSSKAELEKTKHLSKILILNSEQFSLKHQLKYWDLPMLMVKLFQALRGSPKLPGVFLWIALGKWTVGATSSRKSALSPRAV